MIDTASDASDTIAAKVAAAESELAQLRVNREATQRALEDCLARDGDTTSHAAALASHDAKIASTEARLNGLHRLLPAEQFASLVRDAERAYEDRGEAQRVWDAHRADVVRLEAELDAARRRFEAHDRDTQAAYGRYSRLVRELADFERAHPELSKPV